MTDTAAGIESREAAAALDAADPLRDFRERFVIEGPAAELLASEDLRRAYLGR